MPTTVPQQQMTSSNLWACMFNVNARSCVRAGASRFRPKCRRKKTYVQRPETGLSHCFEQVEQSLHHDPTAPADLLFREGLNSRYSHRIPGFAWPRQAPAIRQSRCFRRARQPILICSCKVFSYHLMVGVQGLCGSEIDGQNPDRRVSAGPRFQARVFFRRSENTCGQTDAAAGMIASKTMVSVTPVHAAKVCA